MESKRQTKTRSGRARGFTLIEALICALLMALGFIALVAAFGHDTVVTQRGEDVAVGTLLADEIREMALLMPFADVLALDGTSYSPAILSTGATEDMANWSQHITVVPVAATDLNAQVAAQGAKAARLTVEVRLRGTPVATQTYYTFSMEGVPFTDSGG